MRRFARAAALLLAVLGMFTATAPRSAARAADKPLRALVYEHDDAHTKAHGLREALVRAGFEVETTGAKGPAPAGRADLLVLASFVSEDDGYAKAPAARADTVAAFLRKGGVLLAFTQADQTEKSPPFLPEGLEAVRCDQDFGALTVEAADHPLLQGLARDPKAPDRLALKHTADKPASWETLAWQRGFRVLLSAGPERDRFALLEAGVGQGRLLLSSLHLDKQTRDDGTARLSEDQQRTADRFFENLAVYVRGVRDGTAGDVVATRTPTESAEALGEAATAEWRLALSDVAVYTRRQESRAGGARIPGRADPFTVHGHDLDGGQYRPRAFPREDLAATLALRLPDRGATRTDVALVLEPRDTAPVRLTGAVEARATADGRLVSIAADYAFASAGGKAKDAPQRIESGTAHVHATFDPETGVVQSAHVDLDFELARTDAKRGDRPAHVSESRLFTLVHVKRHRYPEFQGDVDAAIAKGVEWLTKKRRDDGRWDPHGNYDIGTTALVVLTLVACDVPRDDPRVKDALDWIFAQSPERTYERAVCLMAIDKAYAPPGEGATLPAKGGAVRVRDVPPERLAWCKEHAEALEAIASQPGSWGYPNGGRDLQRFDTSNTQYAVLGLRAATHLGVDVSERTWLGVIRHFDSVRAEPLGKGAIALVREGDAIPDEARTTQGAIPVNEVAGFRYSTLHGHRDPWASMTCAGIGSLAIARHQLELSGSAKLGAKEADRIEALIVGAWAWLDRVYAVDRHPLHPSGGWHYYYLYSLERAGILHGVKRVGGRDWYFDGATELLARVKGDGGWGEGGDSALVETCFALLFLKRATVPLTGR